VTPIIARQISAALIRHVAATCLVSAAEICRAIIEPDTFLVRDFLGRGSLGEQLLTLRVQYRKKIAVKMVLVRFGDGVKGKKVNINMYVIAHSSSQAASETLRYMARTKQRRTYLP